MVSHQVVDHAPHEGVAVADLFCQHAESFTVPRRQTPQSNKQPAAAQDIEIQGPARGLNRGSAQGGPPHRSPSPEPDWHRHVRPAPLEQSKNPLDLGRLPRPREEKLVPRPCRPRQVRLQDSAQLRHHLDGTGMRGGLEAPILVRSDMHVTRPQVYVSHPETEHLPDPGTGEGQDHENDTEVAQGFRRLVLLEGMPEDRRDLIL